MLNFPQKLSKLIDQVYFFFKDVWYQRTTLWVKFYGIGKFFFDFVMFFFGQIGEAYWWRVCYQRGLPRLVLLGLGLCSVVQCIAYWIFLFRYIMRKKFWKAFRFIWRLRQSLPQTIFFVALTEYMEKDYYAIWITMFWENH